MKKLFAISMILVFCLSVLAVAVPDLTVENFAVRSDILYAKESYHYVLEVKNVGDEAVETCLPAEIYFEDEPSLKFPNCLLNTLTNTRVPGSEVAPVKIIAEDGSETKQTPYAGEVIYYTPALSPAEVEEKKQEYLARGTNEGMTPEEVAKELEEVEIYWSQRQEHSLEAYLINLAPEETLKFESDKSFNQFEQVTIPLATLSVEQAPLTVNIKLDRLETADKNMDNNFYSKALMIEPTVFQGPKTETALNKELETDQEYFAAAGGCAKIKSKEICVSAEESDNDNEEDQLVISIDGSEEVYSFYGMFMAWLYGWFGDGRVAPAEVNNGVEIILYPNGFKLTFLE